MFPDKLGLPQRAAGPPVEVAATARAAEALTACSKCDFSGADCECERHAARARSELAAVWCSAHVIIYIYTCMHICTLTQAREHTHVRARAGVSGITLSTERILGGFGALLRCPTLRAMPKMELWTAGIELFKPLTSNFFCGSAY